MPAVVISQKETDYEVLLFEKNLKTWVNRIKLRPLDWKYWTQKMTTWNYAQFRKATVTWGTHVGAKSQNEMHIVEALQSREIETVV